VQSFTAASVAGRSFWIDADLLPHQAAAIARRVEQLGGILVGDLDRPIDFLVLAEGRLADDGPSVPERDAARHGNAPRVFYYPEPLRWLIPSRDEALALLAEPLERQAWADAQPLPGDPVQIDLGGADLGGSDLGGFDFLGCDLAGATWTGAVLDGARIVGAVSIDLRGARSARGLRLDGAAHGTFDRLDAEGLVGRGRLRACSFRGTRLAGADLRGADLAGCDLTRADLRHADLTRANLDHCRVDGTDFTGARLRGAKLAGIVIDRAVGLKEALANQDRPGPHLRDLEIALSGKPTVTLAFVLTSPTRGELSCRLACARTFTTLLLTASGQTRSLRAARWTTALLDLADDEPDAVPRLETSEVHGVRAPAQVRRLLGRALCELFRRPAPDEKELARLRKAARAADEARQRDRVAALREPGGVAAWNALPIGDRLTQGRFDGADLAGARLDGIDLSHRSAVGVKLAGASLIGAKLSDAALRHADLAGANLSEARLVRARLDRADLRGANLARASLQAATVCDADLTDADLTGTLASATRYNAGTAFPAGYLPEDGWVFVGPGLPPGDDPTCPALDFDALLARLPEVVPSARVRGALALLREERLQLFADTEATHATGVVRSRGNPRRVFTCRLTAEGCFGCGSARLWSCSSQKGAVCVHLLSLVLGLVRAGRLDAGRAFLWLRRSGRRTPVVDRPALVGTLLKYKGVQAGAVDWRPTETVPEDYYAL